MRKPLPPTYFLVANVLMAVLRVAAPGPMIVQGWWRVLGAIPILVGLAVAMIADKQFKDKGTTVKPFETSSALMTDGVFAWSRNPMYVGFAVVLAGMAVCLGSLTPWFVLPAFVVIIDRTFIVPEEKAMEETFGAQYLDYKKRTRRWI